MDGDRQAEIVRAALDLLDENGLEAVSLRAVAMRIGVRMNTVSWHIKTKARLRDLMADAIIAQIPLDDLPAHGDRAVRELLRRYRRALLAHRDGGRVVAGTFVAEPATLRYADRLIATLLDSGLDEQTTGWTAWTLIYFTLGLVQEEQGAPGGLAEQVASAMDVRAHPALVRVLPHLTDGAFDDRFDYGVGLVLTAAAARSAHT
jgi:TetR/AcrR family tetracycline transcriptional repressor